MLERRVLGRLLQVAVAAEAPAAAVAAVAPAAVAEPPKKQRKVVLSGLLGIRVKKEATSPAPVVARDELDEYLEDSDPFDDRLVAMRDRLPLVDL